MDSCCFSVSFSLATLGWRVRQVGLRVIAESRQQTDKKEGESHRFSRVSVQLSWTLKISTLLCGVTQPPGVEDALAPGSLPRPGLDSSA